jgi:membrane-associated phospholipid phosphatase
VLGNITHQWKQRLLIGCLILLILTIGFSRIYLRMHYTTDVVAGFCLGTIWLVSCLHLLVRTEQHR